MLAAGVIEEPALTRCLVEWSGRHCLSQWMWLGHGGLVTAPADARLSKRRDESRRGKLRDCATSG